MNYPSVEVLVAAVGQDSESPALHQLFSELKIGEENLEKYPMNLAGRRLWWNEATRLQLELKSIELLKDIPSHNIDQGPWVLTKLTFWGVHKKNGAYAGPIPYELDFSMVRDSIRNKMLNIGLGQATVLGFSEDVDMWQMEKVEITVEYFDDNDAIRCISIGVLIDRSRA